MLGFGRKNNVIGLFDHSSMPEVNMREATVLDLVPKLQAPRSQAFWDKLDILGVLVSSTSTVQVRNAGETAKGTRINYSRRRAITGGATALFGAAAIGLASIAAGSHDTTTPDKSYLELPLVDGSETTHDRVTQVSPTVFYEEAGNVICSFSGVQAQPVEIGMAGSQVIKHVKGINEPLTYGNCYDSTIEYVDQINANDYMLEPHDPNTYDGTMPGVMQYPQTVTISPVQ